MDVYDPTPVLIVEPPSHIRFRGPFNRPVFSKISLVNPTSSKIIFKIKTSAPSFYGVQLNFGVVQPQNFVEVQIALQPFQYDPNEKINHKFMILSLAAPPEIQDIYSFWNSADVALFGTTKLRCVFEMPPASTTSVAPMPVESQQTLRLPEIPQSITPRSERTMEWVNESLLQKQIDLINVEIRELRQDNVVLRKENSILKSDIRQVRIVPIHSEEPVVKQIIIKDNKPFTLLYIVSSVVMVVACALIGKFFL